MGSSQRQEWISDRQYRRSRPTQGAPFFPCHLPTLQQRRQVGSVVPFGANSRRMCPHGGGGGTFDKVVEDRERAARVQTIVLHLSPFLTPNIWCEGMCRADAPLPPTGKSRVKCAPLVRVWTVAASGMAPYWWLLARDPRRLNGARLLLVASALPDQYLANWRHHSLGSGAVVRDVQEQAFRPLTPQIAINSPKQTPTMGPTCEHVRMQPPCDREPTNFSPTHRQPAANLTPTCRNGEAAKPLANSCFSPHGLAVADPPSCFHAVFSGPLEPRSRSALVRARKPNPSCWPSRVSIRMVRLKAKSKVPVNRP